MPNFKPRDLLFPLVIFTLFYANQACNQMDRNSLLSLPFKTSSPPLNWSSIDCCQWEGISCDRKGQSNTFGCLIKVSEGVYPLFLQTSHISHTSISPTIHFQLKIVDFSNNYLEGDISSLFSTNGSSLCSNSPFIRFFDFSFNHYSGQIPSGLGRCSKLEIFRIGFNSLSGPLPLDIYSATRLQEISLPSNNLSGLISDDIVKLTRLVKLELYRNNIGGKLPSNIGKLSQLEHLVLHKNSFIGALPPSLMNFTNLIKLNLAYNFFEGEISTFNFSGLSQLAVLDLAANNFTGNLPTSLYSCKSLRAIRLGRNRLEGEIQTNVVQLKFLSFLSLSDSGLTNITKAIKILMHCKALNILFLTSNFLQEAMPTDNSILVMDSSKALLLELDDNLLSGEFPKELCALPALVSPQPLDNTSLDFPIYVTEVVNEYYNSLSQFRRIISVANNSLNGSIPIEIGHLKQLQGLYLRNNKLSGKIPNQISDLTNLERLDLSTNQLTGEIPASLANLHFLNMFSIASNKLHGPIPSGTQLQSFDAINYEGNPGLCGLHFQISALILLATRVTMTFMMKKMDMQSHGFISVVLGFITGFWGVCGLLAINNRWRFTYFRFMDDLQDRIYVKLVVSFRKLHRRLVKS
ncbi:Tyrosine-sulfated glycopeptide receptor 1 [Morella rubra]|uniref:Tyrosine-sulfated glycopeptide receptor 1 n=1 Tax=Morella rubra TaxID=262757 RepID=A0A6A1WRH6_9ROSI|nr:Tyrosine-sulfated glycopeptide receptor 1 [Morella rubra]